MKNICIVCLLFISHTVFAQSGIYMSWQDYQAGKLSNVLNCDSKPVKIKLHHFFSSTCIYIQQGEQEVRFCKDSIFGYRDCAQNTFRFYKTNDDEYRIVENQNIVIYTSDIPVTDIPGKTIKLIPGWFFSASISSDILPLTINNLKRAFPNNLKFHDFLDVEFNSSQNISEYDTIHKMYKVNYLFNKSKNL